jgi:hypothetical protein
MSTGLWGFPASGQKGRWTALVEPMVSRATRFHTLKRSHASDGTAVMRRVGEGPTAQNVIEAVREYEIRFELVQIEEGGPLSEPTIVGRSHDGLSLNGTDDVRDFLQAIVDCAAQMGIEATEAAKLDLTGELDATLNHLDDMRRLAMGDKYAGQVRKTPKERRG